MSESGSIIDAQVIEGSKKDAVRLAIQATQEIKRVDATLQAADALLNQPLSEETDKKNTEIATALTTSLQVLQTARTNEQVRQMWGAQINASIQRIWQMLTTLQNTRSNHLMRKATDS